MTDRRMLLVHAHPDDEVINNGVTMARYVASGAQVTLVTCTLGEEGEVLVPELAMLAAEEADQLGGYRIGELASAMGILGVSDHRFLGGPGRWRDSGMMGVPSNEKPRAFWTADLDTAAADLVPVIREVRPQVLITYDENGGYGHPDHIQAHRVAMRGYELASDPAFRPELGEAWLVQKVYWCATPKSKLREGIERMRELGQETPFGVEDVEDLPMGTPDELVTTAFDGGGFVEAKMEAMKAHATQITVDGPFFALSNNLGQEVWATEHYSLVRGEKAGPFDADGWETDLFAGTT